jgi:anti-sigma B factor antagonist
MTTALLAVPTPTHPDVDVIEFPHSGPLHSGPHTAALIVRLPERLVVENREALKRLIEYQLGDGRRRFVFDMSECVYIDSSGLGMLVSITKKAQRLGGRLVLTELQEDLVTLLELTHMDEVFNVSLRVIDALAWFDVGERVV